MLKSLGEYTKLCSCSLKPSEYYCFFRGFKYRSSKISRTDVESLYDQVVGEQSNLVEPGMETEKLTFNQVDKITDHADKEIYRQRSKVQMKIIEKKYFKSKREPNLLTWSMKQQIKYLHSMDPNDWNPETISQSFPISAQGARKVLKAVWLPADEAAIERYDDNVIKNWKKIATERKIGNPQLLSSHASSWLGASKPSSTVMVRDFFKPLDDVYFEPQDDLFESRNNYRNRIPKIQKRRPVNFANIVKDYEAKVRSINGKPIEDNYTELSTMTTGAEEYEGDFSKVKHIKRKHTRRENNKLLTFSEYMNSK